MGKWSMVCEYSWLQFFNCIKVMERIDYSRFRFRVGDIVTYKGHNYPIVGYFFLFKFNDYTSYYGYTLGNYSGGHNGTGAEYSELGSIITKGEQMWNVDEWEIESKVKGKKKHGDIIEIPIKKRKRIEFNFIV
jgi:hypothetical protein